MRKNYKETFTEYFNWLIKYRNIFTFSGSNLNIKIVFDIKGVDGKRAFHIYESTGKIKPTKHPNIFYKCIKTKASITFQIKQWAEGRADGTLPKMDFSTKCFIENDDTGYSIPNTIEAEYELLPWMIEAVETQKYKYYTHLKE